MTDQENYTLFIIIRVFCRDAENKYEQFGSKSVLLKHISELRPRYSVLFVQNSELRLTKAVLASTRSAFVLNEVGFSFYEVGVNFSALGICNSGVCEYKKEASFTLNGRLFRLSG